MIEPVGDSRPCYDILAQLANRLGYGHLYPQGSDAVLEQVMKGTGYTVDDLKQAPKHTVHGKKEPMVYRKWEKGLLRKDGKLGFETPSGKFEIKSTVLEEFGYEGLPKYEESIETPISNPRMLNRYPLILGTGPFKPDMKSCLRAIPDFIKRYPYPMVQMNPEDAEKRKIKTEDPVVIKTARGQVMMRAFVTEDIMAGFVYAPAGGGGPQGTDEWKKANVNILTDLEQFDPISGFPVYKTLLCQVKKKKRQRRGIAVQDPSLGCVG